MKQPIIRLITLIFALLIAATASAKTLYIHDILRVDMRSGPSLEYRIIDFLRSGTELQVLKEDGEWINIKTSDKEGWIQSQYTSEEPVARQKLVAALTEIQTLKKQNAALNQNLQASQTELQELSSDHNKISSSTEQLQQELDRIQKTSKNAIETEAAYRQLQENTELLKVDIEKLKIENIRLSEANLTEGIQWGAGCVFFGILIAWLISKSATKKRRGEW